MDGRLGGPVLEVAAMISRRSKDVHVPCSERNGRRSHGVRWVKKRAQQFFVCSMVSHPLGGHDVQEPPPGILVRG
jgi:hypothetical protein